APDVPDADVHAKAIGVLGRAQADGPERQPERRQEEEPCEDHEEPGWIAHCITPSAEARRGRLPAPDLRGSGVHGARATRSDLVSLPVLQRSSGFEPAGETR